VIPGTFRFPCISLVLAVSLVGSTLQADTTSAPQPNFHPTLDARPAAGTIEIDGDLGDPGWTNAARATGAPRSIILQAAWRKAASFWR